MQLSKPEGKGKAYDAALGTGGGVPALEAALKTMGAGELAALELEDFEVAGKQRVMVLDVTRARLVRSVPLHFICFFASSFVPRSIDFWLTELCSPCYLFLRHL